MKHLSCPISGALPKDDTSGQLQASTYSAIWNYDLQIDIQTLHIRFCAHTTPLHFKGSFQKGALATKPDSDFGFHLHS